MRLEITRRSDLATRALLELAHEGERTKSAVLAERLETTPGFLSQVMTPLVAKGWVRSDPGPSGGYTLVVDPRRVSVLEIIETMEGPTESGRCVMEDRACAGGGPCALHTPWSAARMRLLKELSRTRLSSLTPGGPV
jgi:Rrf2 family iron-sulfur cluster assembly transcriptional regulator